MRREAMGKIFVLWVTGLLILGLGAPGYAQAPKLEFKASGFIDTQTFLDVNAPQRNTSANIYQTLANNQNFVGFTGAPYFAPTKGLDHTASYWDARAHLKFDAVMGPNLSGTIFFEIDTYRWGSVFNATAVEREANNFGAWTTDRTAVEVKNVYIDVGLPYFGIPVPVTVRVGAQPIGVRPAMLVYSDGTGVTAGIKIDPVLIAPIYAKALENLDFADDDVDVWGIHANAKISTFTVGGYGLYYRMNTYPFYVSGATIVAPGYGGSITGMTGIINQVPGTFKSHMWWFGVYADGKAGPVNVNFDFVYDYGKVEERNTPNIPDVRYQGWATRLKVDYPWQKFNMGAVGMYAAGPDARHASTTGLPGSLTNIGTYSKSVRGYVVPPGSEQDSANNESIVVYGMDSGTAGAVGIAKNANYAQMSRGGFGGTWFAKLYGSVQGTAWYKITLQGLHIADTTKHGDTLGNSVRPGSTLLKDNKNIGWELDLINEIQIYNNLKFTLGGGYLWAGDAVDLRRGTTLTNFSPKNPWGVRTRLMYTF
jgi:hypothetical protein